MLLSDGDIKNHLKTGDITIDPFSGDLEPASYDLRVGHSAVTDEGKVDVMEVEFFRIPRGTTVTIHPLEEIGLSRRIAARYGLRSRFARRGLVLLSGPQIDPGFEGKLTITVFNAGPAPVTVQHLQKFATIEFTELKSPAKSAYEGKYQGRTELGSEEYDLMTSNYRSFSEIEELLDRISADVESIKNFVYVVLFGVLAGVVVALIGQGLS